MSGHLTTTRHDRAFSVMVLLMIAGVAAGTLWRNPALRAPGPAALLLVMATAHAALHAFFFLSPGKARPRALLYLGVQAAIAVGLGFIAGSPLVTLTLCLALIGEAVGSLPRARAVLAAALLFALFAAHALGTGKGSEALLLLGAGVPTVVFVVVYVELMRRESRAREEAQAALAELDSAHQALAAYAQKVEELTLAGERQRMARELHDTLAQGLAGVILQLGALEAYLSRGDNARVQAILRQTLERARATLADARRAIDDLRAVPARSLAEHAQGEAERFTLATGIACEVEVDAALSLAPELLAHAERCVSEGLANAARHARATQVRVRAGPDGGAAVVEIEDDGVGFDPSAAQAQAGHYGLIGLRERARLAGGALEVKSAPGRGTRVRLTLPLSEAA